MLCKFSSFHKRERIQEKPTAEQSERVTSRLNLRIEEYSRTVLIVATCQLYPENTRLQERRGRGPVIQGMSDSADKTNLNKNDRIS